MGSWLRSRRKSADREAVVANMLCPTLGGRHLPVNAQRTSITGTGEWRATCSATEPIMARHVLRHRAHHGARHAVAAVGADDHQVGVLRGRDDLLPHAALGAQRAELDALARRTGGAQAGEHLGGVLVLRALELAGGQLLRDARGVRRWRVDDVQRQDPRAERLRERGGGGEGAAAHLVVVDRDQDALEHPPHPFVMPVGSAGARPTSSRLRRATCERTTSTTRPRPTRSVTTLGWMSMNATTSSVRRSYQVARTSSQPCVAAANASIPSSALRKIRMPSGQPVTPISSSLVLKMNMNGRMAVRMS